MDHLLTLKPVRFLEGELIHDVSIRVDLVGLSSLIYGLIWILFLIKYYSLSYFNNNIWYLFINMVHFQLTVLISI